MQRKYPPKEKVASFEEKAEAADYQAELVSIGAEVSTVMIMGDRRYTAVTGCPVIR